LLLELVVQAVLLQVVCVAQMAAIVLSTTLSSLQVVEAAAALVQDKLQIQVDLVVVQGIQTQEVVHHLSLVQQEMFQQLHLLREMLVVQPQLNILLVVVAAQEQLL
jgi:hypothetical protein